MHTRIASSLVSPRAALAVCGAAAGALLAPAAAQAQACERDLTADVVALDQQVFYNRLGAFDPGGMMYALRRDVVAADPSQPLGPGNARLRAGKRPRPMALRMNEGDCLTINFTNLLATTPVDQQQPATRKASVHVVGMQAVDGVASDGSHVGRNTGEGLVAPGGSATYKLYAQKEGTFLLYSDAATVGGEGNGGSISRGLFGAVNVEPRGSKWYRSQVTAVDMQIATRRDAAGTRVTTPAGQPVLDYAATYPAGHPRAGEPVLAMLRGTEIVNTDLNAVITGSQPDGRWAPNTFHKVVAAGDREQPFREFTVIFHDETGVVQAFKEFEDPQLEYTLHGGRDAFAINYGSAGVGAEVLANRKGLGPMGKCPECKGEEFFLSSWAVGDPSMVVDVPANASNPAAGVVATKALYADDPSNVHHSYMNDRVKFRNLHAGPKEHHIFHLHAHQWLRTADADNSTLLDSQGIGPGSGYTYEIAYSGGNRNKMAGDAIFHCHFYPHFAQGMWSMWRTHDVFEAGTVLDADGVPVAGGRSLPDAEIAVGTPIPAVVPLPGRPLPLMPGASGNPGFPFYIAGRAGHRPPKPPMATVQDGGLPRHVVTGGEAHFLPPNPHDFDKTSTKLGVAWLPENGTPAEQAAMRFHATRSHASYAVAADGSVQPGGFTANGRAPVAGAPFSDPCVADNGAAAGTRRVYKAAAFQMDAKYNKAGWHFPQHRMFSLWDDVQATIGGTRPPQPMFLRTSTDDCINFHLVNLVPHRYEMDDYQVTTPTDVIGQHIHLVKFDVTSSDGAANGFNYESGALSPDEVRERIAAIRAFNGCTGGASSADCPSARAHPTFGAGPNGKWVGAQEIVERWYTDNLLNSAGQDRTLRSVFTHDHFGPSTHQQTGLYAAVIGEPKGSQWRDPETGAFMGSRGDGGPTSWRADILTAVADSSYREFNLEFSDFVPAYKAEATGIGPHPKHAINPPGKEHGDPHALYKRPETCPNGTPAPCPEIVSADDPGTMLVNYRNEPLALRLRDPATNRQAAGDAGDASLAFSSSVRRADPQFNAQPTFYPALTKGMLAGDPFTPLLRAYENDKVQVRVLVGGQEEGHNFSMHGLKWLTEPSWGASGYKASQWMGLSEHFELVLPPLPGNTKSSSADYLYKPGSSAEDLWNGLWGILRSYRSNQTDLLALPRSLKSTKQSNGTAFNGVCPRTAPMRAFAVTAVTAQQALPGGAITYNGREGLTDPTAAVFVRSTDLDAAGKLRAGVRVEPLILRANAGDCIELTLANKLPAAMPNMDGWSGLPMLVDDFNANDVRPSSRVGLHAQMVATDVTSHDGVDVGTNNGRSQTVAPGGTITYRWYAGHLDMKADGSLQATPAEFGAVNLTSSDPIKHSNKGLIGALVIEPQGAVVNEDADGDNMRASADVSWTGPDGKPNRFREFVLLFQDDLNLRDANGAVPNTAEAEDAEDSGQKAFNYRTEPLWARMGHRADLPLGDTRLMDFAGVLSNDKVGGDPETPVFSVAAGTPVRFRVLQPGGHQRNHVFQVHGHGFQESPFTSNSLGLGDNPLSEWKGSQFGIGPSSHFDLLLTNGAGGKFARPGDYLFRDMNSFMFDGGLWGLLRVLPAAK